MGDAKFLVEGFHEACRELGTSVRDDLGRDPMETEDFAVMDVRNTLCIYVRRGGQGVDLFAVMISVDDNGIVPFDWGQPSDEVHPHSLPWAFRDIVGLEYGTRVLSWLVALANVAARHIFIDKYS